MFGITDLTTFIIGTTLIVLLPGPNSLYVMSIASRFGIKTGYMGALGVYTGDLILIICTALGAASLLHAFPVLFIALKVIGAIYLSYLGIKLIIAAYQTFFPEKSSQRVQIKKTTPDTVESVQPFRTALTISILNPKAILFYLSFFVQFVDPAYPYPALTFTLLASMTSTAETLIPIMQVIKPAMMAGKERSCKSFGIIHDTIFKCV